ncbi:hypothetical protein [Zunongwangia profunda]|uniref:hypothetical protein n=1 Tax=Zunongwangia profunda TaxID=398743 RepID=UPI000C8F211D|nr:hypothetical protein [Zunongwangia profunda]MAG88182.1 hypothetical protein [Flavobacteriaceae bacterium]MCC4229515.1 hypothetical protein [Zunongwangia profunda]|tara:strand:+ start:10989 stop:11342 length:354 start_codon:yes stop_codon:yes gene_type:complete
MTLDKIGNLLLDAILKGNPQDMNNLFTEDCKLFIPFPEDRKISGVHKTITYFYKNHKSQKDELTNERKCIVSKNTRILIYTKVLDKDQQIESVVDYCAYCKLENKKNKGTLAVDKML